MADIPPFVVEYFLLGRTRREATERYTQDGGVVSDVWLRFAKDQNKPSRVLIAPSSGVSAVKLGLALHQAVTGYRASLNDNREAAGISPLENFVSATLYFDELLRVVLPLTTWWHKKHLGALRRKAFTFERPFEASLEQAILGKLGRAEGEARSRSGLSDSEESWMNRRIIEAAPLAALIGVFRAADRPEDYFADIRGLDPRGPDFEEKFVSWVNDHAEDIARASCEELTRQFETSMSALQSDLDRAAKYQMRQTKVPDTPEEPPEMIQRVFLDREAGLADVEANRTVKADAASRLFDVCCRDIAWAVVDSGVATTHPAFLDHDAKDRRGRPLSEPQSRIKQTLDFTHIEKIRNFDLTIDPDGSPQREAAIANVADLLASLPGRAMDPQFTPMALQNLRVLARQLEQCIQPDWNLIEPLINIGDKDDGASLVSDHGTHVAGILGADWRSTKAGPGGQPESLLQGICPDIGLYDLRVIHPNSKQRTEFAVLAALEYVQFANARAGSNGPVIHGVNISLSIPHDVRNYGCGSTPVCVACDRLVGSGVVVVAAAGNRGWNEMEMGFGNFVFCSITDPGNARDVITVGSTHRSKPHLFGVSYFSSRGPTGDGRAKPDLVAPGEQIRGPVRGDADDELDGTSMASPFVSGAAAMLLARNRELIGNPARVKEILCRSATDLGREKYFQGNGLVDVLRAMQSL